MVRLMYEDAVADDADMNLLMARLSIRNQSNEDRASPPIAPSQRSSNQRPPQSPSTTRHQQLTPRTLRTTQEATTQQQARVAPVCLPTPPATQPTTNRRPRPRSSAASADLYPDHEIEEAIRAYNDDIDLPILPLSQGDVIASPIGQTTASALGPSAPQPETPPQLPTLAPAVPLTPERIYAVTSPVRSGIVPRW